MSAPKLTPTRVAEILVGVAKVRILVVGDAMLDHFIWGSVGRISPEAPVPVVEFERENFMPGGAANVARNLAALKCSVELFGVVGQDHAARQLKSLLEAQRIGCGHLMATPERLTSVKTRVVAHKQQVVRVDRETRNALNAAMTDRLIRAIKSKMSRIDAVIIGDYGKGVVTQLLLKQLKNVCHKHGVWLSLDPKPLHALDLAGLSLITPNRKEAFALASLPDETRNPNPLADKNLMKVTERLLGQLRPAVLLITLGDLGMLLCHRHDKPFHIPTIAQEVFDVSGAGDTVISTFTLCIAAGASPLEAAIISNHAAGIVVGKLGTATVGREELLESFANG